MSKTFWTVNKVVKYFIISWKPYLQSRINKKVRIFVFENYFVVFKQLW